MEKILQFLLKSIISSDKLKITSEEENGVSTLKMTVAKEDIGKVIGKGGRTIKALTALTRVKAIKEGKKVILQVEEKDSS